MTHFLRNTSTCNAIAAAAKNVTHYRGFEVSIEKNEGLLIICLIGILACIVAALFSAIRKNVYMDMNELDTSFDAGGKVNAGLTATTIVSQWTWVATIVYSSTVATKFGLSGSLWYASGASIQILLFSIISVQLKIRAPGAKTYLQVIRARFGKTAHTLFCGIALMTNIFITANLMLGGCRVIASLVKDLTMEFATTVTAIIVGLYTAIGGLGATFYVSYFNTATIYICMLLTFYKVYDDHSENNPLGSVEYVYTLISCKIGPPGNRDNSYLTIFSHDGLFYGIVNIVGCFGVVFVDQAYWQSSVAAKPKQGVLGFLAGGLVWFAVPFCLGTTIGFAYLAVSARQNHQFLTQEEIDSGLIFPAVAHILMGPSGERMLLLMVLMAITSTGSAEIIAVTSILVYDVYAIYMRPYRLITDSNNCLLCGKGRGRMATPRDKCLCVVMKECNICKNDDLARSECKRAILPDYKCVVHGPYRVYLDYLSGIKNWCLLWITFSILPITLTLYALQVPSVWIFNFLGLIIGASVPSVSLSIFWARLSVNGLFAGSLLGPALAVASCLVLASRKTGGLQNFFQNTGNGLPAVVGNAVSILSGLVLTVAVSIATNSRPDEDAANEVWEKTRDIDNPLSPWPQNYAVELNLTDVRLVDNRPSLQAVSETFKKARYIAYIGSISISFVLVVVWPCSMMAAGVLSLQEFRFWVKLLEVWGVAAALFIIIAPLLNEAYDISTAGQAHRRVGDSTED